LGELVIRGGLSGPWGRSNGYIAPPHYNGGMKIQFDRFVLVLVALFFSACASAPPEVAEPRPPGTGRVEVTMTGFKSEEGQALIAFFLDGNGWPNAEEAVFQRLEVEIRDGQAVAMFDDVPAGPFAISAFHDTNDDKKLNTNVVGAPSEPYGFSADARGTFSAPSFEEARLELAAGETKQITIQIK
jgi:uncharacterized protein (DUF2141 family)